MPAPSASPRPGRPWTTETAARAGDEAARPGSLGSRITESGHELVLYAMAYGNVRLCIGVPAALTYDRGWCYRSHASGDAFAAVESWDGSGVPPGRWYKDLGTGEIRDDMTPGTPEAPG